MTLRGLDEDTEVLPVVTFGAGEASFSRSDETPTGLGAAGGEVGIGLAGTGLALVGPCIANAAKPATGDCVKGLVGDLSCAELGDGVLATMGVPGPGSR